MNQHPFRAIVVGGSVGGLAGALELRRSAHAEVAVYERSSGQMQARGAGVCSPTSHGCWGSTVRMQRTFAYGCMSAFPSASMAHRIGSARRNA